MSRVQMSLILVIYVILLAACGGGSSSDSNDGDSSAAVPTKRAIAPMPAAQFQSVGNQSGITTTLDIRDTTESDPNADTEADLALGERVYGMRCAECHGDAATGGSASAIAGLTTEEAAFVDLLRTGGELGPEHLFGTRAISDNGIAGLYSYLRSLE